MTSPFQPKQIQVPGLLSDDAFQEKLKQFSSQKNVEQNAAPAPNSAVEFADKIRNEYLNVPLPTIKGKPMVKNENLQSQDRAMDVRSDMLSGIGPDATGIGQQALRQLILGPVVGAFGEGSLIAKQFAYTPEQAQEEADNQLEQAKESEAATAAAVDARVKLRGQVQDNATDLGFSGDLLGEDDAAQLDAAEQDRNKAAAKTTEQKQKAAEGKTVQPSMPWWLNSVREGYKAAAGTPLSVAKGGIAAWELTAGAILNGGDLERSDVRAWVQTVEQTLDKMMPGDKTRAQDFSTQLAAGGGSMLAFMMGGVVGKVIGLPAGYVPAIMGATSQGAEGLEDAESFNAVGYQKYLAFILNAGLGVSEAAPIDRMFMNAEKLSGGLVSRMLVNTTAGSLEEFIQEFGQAMGQDVVAKMVYDESRALDVDKWAKQGAVGALTGGLAGASVQIMQEAGVTSAPPSDMKVDDAAREEAANLVIDMLQERFDDMVGPDEGPADVGMSAEEAASAVLNGELVGVDLVSPGDANLAPFPTSEKFTINDPAIDDIPASELDGVEVTLSADQSRAPEGMRSVILPGGTEQFVGEELLTPAAEETLADVAPQGERFVEGPGGTVPVDESGNVVLRHFSGQQLDEIDPAKRGTGPVRGKERDRLGGTETRRFWSKTNSMGKTLRNDDPDAPVALEIRDEIFEGRDRKEAEAAARAAGISESAIRKGIEGIVENVERDPNVVDRSYFGVGTPPTEQDVDALFRDRRDALNLPVYTEPDADGMRRYPRHEAERRAFRKHVHQKGYAPEAGLGTVEHIVEADPATIYNAIEDPLGLRAQADRELAESERVTQFERLVRDAGFKGLYYPESELGQVVLMFEKTKPARVRDTRTGMNLTFEVVDPRTVPLEATDTRPLPGLTTSEGPVRAVIQAARAYAAARGLPVRRQAEYVKADPERGARIAEAYDKMKHQPNNPKVKAAYKAMADETLAQYQFVKASGLQVEAIEPGMDDPYPGGPKEVLADLARGHLWFYPTDQGFGSSDLDVSDNPLLAPTDEWIGGRQLVVNDVFRIVHDYFGHGIEGSGFGARGEENAWQSHMRLYSSDALPAVTSETRGQNSWVNFGPYGEQNRSNQRDTVYADQKTGIMPEWTWTEGVADDTTETDILASVGAATNPERIERLATEIPGVVKVLPYLAPDEQAKLRRDTAAKIVKMFGQLPSAKEMAAVAYSGRAKRGWYARSAQALLDIFGVEDAPRFSALLAALSPQTSVENNAITALIMWTKWNDAGRPTDKAAIKRLLAASVIGAGGDASVLPAWTPNTITALTHPDASSIEISGPKVSSFMKNLNGVVNEVTNDAWMANFANVNQTLFAKSGASPGKGPGYIAMSAVTRAAADAASKMTGTPWTPAEVQETVWSWARTLYSKASSETTAVDILKAGDLTAEEIGATPDFASLFVSGAYREVLEKGGYDLDKLAGRSGDGGSVDGATGSPLSSEGSGIAQSAFDAHLRRAARRLDALRAARQEEKSKPRAAKEELAEEVEEETYSLPDHITDDDLDAFATVGVPVRTDALPLFPALDEQSFDRWFEGSVVRHDDGTPAVVYHGTPRPGFEQFDPKQKGITSVLFSAIETQRNGFFFADNPEFAKGFAEQSRTGEVMPVFLSIKNPFDARESTNVAVTAFEQDVWPRMIAIDPELNNPDFIAGRIGRDDFWETLDTVEGGDVFVQALQEAGYDGIRMYEPNHDTRDSESVWVAFKPEQVKSALRNTGAYNPDRGNIYAMAGTSATRGAYKAEQVRPKQGIATQPGQQSTENADVSLSKITRNLTKLLNLTLRQGRISMSVKDSFGNKMDVMGQYSKGNDVARVRTMNDLSTVVHEAGHALYFRANAPLKQFVQQNEKQLMDVATALYGGDTNTMPKATHIAEGFAEFFRIYTLNRAFAARKYGKVTTAFDEMLTNSAPALKDGLDVIGQHFAAWLQLPSSQMVANMIVSGKQDTGINAAIAELREAGFQSWFHKKARGAVEQGLNRYASLDSLINQTLNIGQENRKQSIDLLRSEDPRALIRLAQNTGARAQVQLADGVMGYRSVTSETRGLRDALLLSQGRRLDQQIGKLDPVRQKDFAAYLVALRGIDEYRRLAEGKIERPPVAATLGDLKLTVDEMNGKYPEFAEAATIAHEYAMGLWKKAYDAGLMTKEAYEDSLDRQFYAPLQRDMSDKKSAFGDGPLTGGNKLVKQFKGSDRDVIDPMDVLMHKTFALEQNIARNDVMKFMAKLADKTGKAGAMIERIPAQQLIGTQFSVKEIARQLTKDENMTEADAADMMTLLEASIKDEKTLALFRQQQAATLGENIVFFWEDGRLAALQLADGDIGADVVNVVNGLGRENLGLLDAIVNPIAATTTAFRSAVTLWPDFLLVNFIRDQMSAFILTNVGYKPFWSGLKGVGDEVRQKQWAKQYNAAMGIMGGMNVSAMHDANVKRDIAALRRKGYIASVFSERTLPGAIRGIARAVELAETGSRLGIFRAAYERAKADGLNDWDASIEASYIATDYMNFGLNGSKMLLARRTVPFLNAQLQGLYKMARTLGADEVRQRKGIRFALSAFFKSTKNMDLSRTEKQAVQTGRVAWLKMASLGLISAALHFLFEDDPDYQEAGEYLRTTGWVIPLGDGKLAYIPKPFELALMANFTERAFEMAGGDETAKWRLLRGMAMTMTPPTSPPAIQSLIEYKVNRDFFTGQEIVPSYMQALAPELQFNNYTTAFAKEIGEITGWSPMLIDHFMSSLGASAYKDLTGIYNAFDPNRPAMDASDTMISRRFIRDVRRGSASSKDFWRLASTLNGSMRRAEMSYRRYLEAGNPEKASAYLDTLNEDERAYAVLNGNFDVEAKRLNPLYRVRQVNTIVSAMRREMVSDLGVDDTTVKNSGETIKLSKREKKDLDLALSEYARREMRNTMIAQNVPGWGGKKRMNTETTLNLIGSIDPRMREELDRRIAKAKVYNAEIVEEYWPEVQDRLIRDRENAFLKDVIAVAKAVR